MASTRSTVFTGVDNIGKLVFDVEPFAINQEAVYINGARLTRNIDYTVVSTDPDNPDSYTRILLDSTEYPTGMAHSDDVLEVLTDIIGAAVVDPTLLEILDRIEDIATATYGSWRWSKRDGILTMYDRSGAERFKFNVDDDAESAARERRQDLEV